MTKWRFVAPPPGRPPRRGPIPTFSVVIPTYQAAETVGEAIDSALAQTCAPREVIVCDDGSTDDTLRVLAQYGGRIKLLRREHNGVAAARNTAIRAATADFLAFLDADDAFHPERLEALGELAATRPDLDIITTDEYLEVDGQVIGRHCDSTPFPTRDQRAAIIVAGFAGHPAVRRELLIDAGGFDEAFQTGEDWECWMHLILAGAQVGLVDEPLLSYRLGPRGLTARRATALRARVDVLDKHKNNPHLDVSERALLERALARARRRAILAESELALRERLPSARRSLVAVATSGDFPWKQRTRAWVALLAPRLAARWLKWRQRRGASSWLDTPVDRWTRQVKSARVEQLPSESLLD
jgi:glycosyltransferase involved in cell wall biosynthesis